jgi:hypothetical protein
LTHADGLSKSRPPDAGDADEDLFNKALRGIRLKGQSRISADFVKTEFFEKGG